MIENIEILLKYNNLNIKEIINILSFNEIFYLLSFIKKINDNMMLNENEYLFNDNNLIYIKNNQFLNRDEKETLINYFLQLGKTDTNGQIINCKIYKDVFNKRLKEIESNEIKECNSTGILILCIGFFIVFLIV